MLAGVQYHLLRIIVFYLKRNESFDMWKDFNFMTLIEGLRKATDLRNLLGSASRTSSLTH